MTTGCKTEMPSLLTLTVECASATPQDFGRRNSRYRFRRLVVPSLIADYTSFLLRQAGAGGAERFLVWAGTLAGGDGFVSTVMLPRTARRAMHSEVRSAVAGRVLEALDARDLVPLAQVHSHPAEAFLSLTDRQRPLISMPGFWSIVVPDFGFVAPDPRRWAVYEFKIGERWRELAAAERAERVVLDASLVNVE